MKRVAFGGWLMALVLGLASMYAAQQPAVAQAPPPQPGDTQLNSAVKSTMTCGEITALLRSEDRRTGGLAILWLDGFYSGHSGLAEWPSGWMRTVSQGVGGTCAISVNADRAVLDVIGQLHPESAR